MLDEVQLERSWDTVHADWDNAAKHDAFFQRCVDVRNLGFAAAKYRQAAADPDRKDFAEKKLRAAALLATQLLTAEQSKPAPKVPRWITVFAGTVAALSVGMLAWFLYQ